MDVSPLKQLRSYPEEVKAENKTGLRVKLRKTSIHEITNAGRLDSDEQFLVYFNAVLPAVSQIVIHEPEDIEGLKQIVAAVIEFK